MGHVKYGQFNLLTLFLDRLNSPLGSKPELVHICSSTAVSTLLESEERGEWP